MAAITAADICELVDGQLEGDPEITVTGVESLDQATEQNVSFLGNPKYAPQVLPSHAAIVLVPEDFDQPTPAGRTWIRCANPSVAFSYVVACFAPEPVEYTPGIHPTAVVADNVVMGADVSVGPHAVIEPGVELGERTVIGAGSYVGHETRLGDDCLIYPNVTIRERCRLGNDVIIHSGTTIGSDGFGYIPGRDGHTKIPQVGIVQIDDDVEIGANVAVDRARFGRTWIKTGVKIDNLVQVAHNVVIGEYSFIVSQVGIAGSSRLGRNVTAAGQVGISGHLDIGAGATMIAQAGISKDVPPGAVVAGAPAVDRKEFARGLYAVGRVPKLVQEVKALQAQVKALQAALGQDGS